jgi:outer membrane immunogenic protein
MSRLSLVVQFDLKVMKMNRISAAAAASVLVFSSCSAALAADLPSKTVAPVFAAAPAFSWTGFYAGVNAGYTWAGNKDASVAPGADPTNILPAIFAAGQFPRSVPLDARGFIGGAQIGYNHQFAGTAFVLGVEADIQFTDARKSAQFVNTGIGSFYNASTRMDYLGTLRGRLGFAVSPQLLIYATGGLAYGQIKYDSVGGGPGVRVTFNSTATKIGYVLGAGAEYAFNRNWSLKTEYLFYDLGKTAGQTTPFQGGPFTTLAVERKNTGHILRTGVNYRF